MKFKNKVCVITGGANGIGRCTAEEFLAEGAKVAVIDTDKKAGEALARKYGGGCLFVCGDITKERVLIDFSNKIIKKYGDVDFLINNACFFGKRGLLSNCGFDDFNYILMLGATAPYMLAKLFKDNFNKGASIVNIASTRAFMSQPDTESYSAAKGAIVSLTHALSVSLSGKVRVNSISPGWIDVGAYHGDGKYLPKYSKSDKKQHPAGRVGRPEDIAKTILFLCGDEAGFITGENITVDGGMTKLMVYHNDYGWKLK
ncbi:MAG: SDR family oxidoreductase [Endomicrobia bacterium]|nr:SDR family oxidoreductase [Endomicrobiia bacterium]